MPVIVWSSIFDETHPEPGASGADIERFVASVGQPISSSEIDEIKSEIQEIKRAPGSESWLPIDPSRWLISNKPLPVSYLNFLQWSNGGEFRTGERRFQFFPVLDPLHGVRAMLLAYHLPQHLPETVPFAFNGSGTFYLFDMRNSAIAGEYAVICCQAGNLGWEPDQFMRVADSFLAACQGTIDVDDLWWR